MGEFVEAEGEAVEKADRLFDGLRRLGEEPRHLRRGFEVTLGVGLGQAPRRLERRSLADAGDDVGERAPLGRMHQRVVGRDERRAKLTRQRRAPRKPSPHVLAIGEARADPEAAAEGLAEVVESLTLTPALARKRERGRYPSPACGRRWPEGPDEGQRHDLQPFAMLDQILDAQMAFALGRAQISRRQDPAEPAISRAVFRIGEHVRRPVVKGEPRAGRDPRARNRSLILARKHMRPHDARERIAIGDPDPRKFEFGGARDHFLGMRSPAQKRKIRHRRQLGEARLEADHESRPSSGRASRVHLLPQAGEGMRPLSRLRERAGVRASARTTMATRTPPRSSQARFRARFRMSRLLKRRIV